MTVRTDFQPISIDPIKLVDSYLDGTDWRRKENSSATFSIGGLILHEAGAISANYWLHKIYNEEVSNAHQSCDIHIHDLSGIMPYCCGHNIRDLLEEGLGGVKYKINSNPPNHLNSAMQQIVNYLGILQNEWAGAQAFNSFDTYLSPFIRKDEMNDKEIKQCMQTFLWGINTPSRWGTMPPFSNVTLDLTPPKDLLDKHPMIGGVQMPFVYGDLQPEIDRFNTIFFETFSEGDSIKSVFQYPILTVNITPDFRWDHPVTNKLFELDAKYGSFYFTNMVNSDLKPEDLRSLCCRLLLDLRELRKKNGGLFGAAESTGSIGVVTINLPKMAYLSKSKEELFDRIEGLMRISKDSLELKRVVLNKFLNDGLYPYTQRYLKAGFENHFSTIGIIGMHEMCRNFFRNTRKKDWGLPKDEAITLCEEVLKFMREKCADFQEETGNLYNLEAVPGESTCYRLALHDKKKHHDIITAGTASVPYYTNSCHLPVGYTDDPWTALKVQERLQTLFTGGVVFHSYSESNDIPAEKVKEFIKKVILNTRIPYVTWTPTIRVCQKHGIITNTTSNDTCPFCLEEAKTEYSKKLTELEEHKNRLLESLSTTGQPN
jgi:ribonucleoside-triphosphate reductase